MQPLPDQDLFYDEANPDFGLLQKANQGLAGFPVDRTGKVDWMEARRSGLIQPRADLRDEAAMDALDLDIVLKHTKEMPWVLFLHRAHTLWLDCSNCHPRPFEARAGAHVISMNDIFRGRYCGMCHDRVAFVTDGTSEHVLRPCRACSEVSILRALPQRSPRRHQALVAGAGAGSRPPLIV